MALVQASETASLRSSTRSSASARRDDATDATTRRTMAMNSGREGTSSSSTSARCISGARCIGPASLADVRVLLLGDCLVDRRVDGKHLGQPGDLEDLEDPLVRAHESEVAVVAAQALEPSHQDTEPG